MAPDENKPVEAPVTGNPAPDADAPANGEGVPEAPEQA